MSPNTFRFLVVLSVLLDFASAFLDTLFPGLIPSSIAQAFENEPLAIPLEGWVWHAALVLAVTVVILYIVGAVGLCFFKRWARSFFLYLTVLTFAFYPILGVIVSSTWSGALSDMSSLLSGGILALAYYSPLRERFARTAAVVS